MFVPASAQLSTGWTFSPGPLILVALGLVLYVVRWRRLRAGDERGARPSVGRLVLWVSGLAVVLLALVSPIDRMADQLLVWHMVQHVLLLDIVPILCLLGLTKVLLRPVTRRLQPLERSAGALGHPVTAALLYVGVLYLWHIAPLYDAAADHASLHALEHLSFAVAGGLYWWHLLSPVPSRLRLGGMGPVVYMIGTKLGAGGLGLLLGFAQATFYTHYERTGTLAGLTPHEDQQLAGVVMALEQSIVMGIVLAWLFARMLAESEREQQRRERLEDAVEA